MPRPPSSNAEEKLRQWCSSQLFGALPEAEQAFLRQQAREQGFSAQELRQLGEIAADLNSWGLGGVAPHWPGDALPRDPKLRRRAILEHLRGRHEQLRAAPNHYPESFSAAPDLAARRVRHVTIEKRDLGLGWCPVASPRTRCCNLLTLDAVENCGFDCSYCSIQSFYHGDEVRFDRHFADKLARLELDPEQHYHIGTGQSSDSLMWGNRQGVLDALMDFARRNPNVTLELKTKSRNIAYLLKHEIPANVLVTWSLNTQTLIDNEEHLTASLEERLRAARRVADRGILVGFHFHPMIHYDRWREDYGDLFARLTRAFSPEEVVLVSLGTLTFIKPVMKQLRARAGFRSQILKMPLVRSDGKWSYPDAIKQALFRHAVEGLAAWREQVFFYLCMENPRHWRPVFGYDYPDNQAFEEAMKRAYRDKITRQSAGS